VSNSLHREPETVGRDRAPALWELYVAFRRAGEPGYAERIGMDTLTKYLGKFARLAQMLYRDDVDPKEYMQFIVARYPNPYVNIITAPGTVRLFQEESKRDQIVKRDRIQEVELLRSKEKLGWDPYRCVEAFGSSLSALSKYIYLSSKGLDNSLWTGAANEWSLCSRGEVEALSVAFPDIVKDFANE
jgi:hypothetical protein